MIRPPKLIKGDKVALISTARAIDQSQIDSVCDTLISWGLIPSEGASLREIDNQFAGTDTERASDLQIAINDDSVKAIICFRGGYGTVRLLDKVDFSNLKTNPKWICGYSDVTALHNHLHTNVAIESLHSTMPTSFEGNTKEALETFRKSLFGETFSIDSEVHVLNRNGNTTGQLIGGNLSMIYSLCGTSSDIDTSDKILFLEDLDEYLYHVDRMMQNLKLGGKLNNLKGLIIGGMTDMNDNDIQFGQTAEEIILSAVSEYDFPICFGFPVGHIDDNRTLTCGADYNLSVTKLETILTKI